MSKKRQKAGGGSGSESPGGGWELVFSGFVLILLCFFIMICSFSSMEAGKVTRFVRSFSKAVNILDGGMGFEPNKVILSPTGNLVEQQNELADIYTEFQSFAESAALADLVTMEISGEGLNLRLSDAAVFSPGKADIEDRAVPLLKKIGSTLARTSYRVRIEGHTDNTPIHTSRFPSNWELSTARAVNVLRFFLSRYPIEKTRLSAVGFGEYQPLFSNNTAADRARNRRVEITLIPPDTDLSVQDGSSG